MVSYGDKSSSKLLGFGKVVITPDVSLVNVMLVKTIGYNLLSVCQLATMGYATYLDVDFVVVMWSKNLKVAFVGYVENGLYDKLLRLTWVYCVHISPFQLMECLFSFFLFLFFFVFGVRQYGR
jgi:hypothetical protein